MSRTSSPMEAKLPERITSAVKSAKKRSTSIVVLDQMDVEFLGRFAVDLLQESQPFDMSVARLSARDQLAFHRIECRKQRDRAMPGVVVRHRPGTLGRKRQTELSTLQSLALALLVAA